MLRPHKLLFVVLFSAVCLAQVAFAQRREITAKEFQSAEAAAYGKSFDTYPRIETYTHKLTEERSSWSQVRVESESRRHRVQKLTTEKGMKLTEQIDYDNESFERADKGKWRTPEPSLITAFPPGPPTRTVSYSVEDITEDGKSFKLYTETRTLADARIYTNTFKLDATGRVVESKDALGNVRLTVFEYPKKIDPVTKPKLGSRK